MGQTPISAEGAVPLSCFIYKRLIVTDGDFPKDNKFSPDDDLSIEQLFSRDRESALEGDLLEKLREFTDTHDTRDRLRGCRKWTVKAYLSMRSGRSSFASTARAGIASTADLGELSATGVQLQHGQRSTD